MSGRRAVVACVAAVSAVLVPWQVDAGRAGSPDTNTNVRAAPSSHVSPGRFSPVDAPPGAGRAARSVAGTLQPIPMVDFAVVPNPAWVGQAVTLTATVSGGSGAPTGQIAFQDFDATFATMSLPPSGQVAFRTTSLAAGVHSLSASYGGDQIWAPATSPLIIAGVIAPPAAVVVARGASGDMVVTMPGRAPVSYGGSLAAAPAVVGLRSPATDLYVATAADGNLWVRTDGLSWRPLGPHLRCLDSPAVTSGGPGTVVIACQGADHALWWTTSHVGPTTGLPTPSSWSSLGGSLSAGPSVAMVQNVATFVVVGGDHLLYARTPTTGYHRIGWPCSGHPAIATDGSSVYVACDGPGRELWIAQFGPGRSTVMPLGGCLLDGVGMAVSIDAVIVVAEGCDGRLWSVTVEKLLQSTRRWSPSAVQVRGGANAALMPPRGATA